MGGREGHGAWLAATASRRRRAARLARSSASSKHTVFLRFHAFLLNISKSGNMEIFFNKKKTLQIEKLTQRICQMSLLVFNLITAQRGDGPLGRKRTVAAGFPRMLPPRANWSARTGSRAGPRRPSPHQACQPRPRPRVTPAPTSGVFRVCQVCPENHRRRCACHRLSRKSAPNCARRRERAAGARRWVAACSLCLAVVAVGFSPWNDNRGLAARS